MEQAPRWLRWTLTTYPVAALAALFLGPLVMLLVVSFFRHVSGGGLFVPTFTTANYAQALEAFYLTRLAYTLGFAALTAAICLLLALPFTYYLAREAGQRMRALLLGVTVSTLWLTTIVRAFGWSVLLSRSAGIGQLLHWLGLVSLPPSYAPGFAAALIGMCYIYFPFMVLSIYNALRAINPELEEASMSLGAPRMRTFVRIVLPLVRRGMVTGYAFVFLLTVGTFVIPQVLGQPPQWTQAVFITNAAIYNGNIPLASALAVVLAVITAVLLFVAMKLGGREQRE